MTLAKIKLTLRSCWGYHMCGEAFAIQYLKSNLISCLFKWPSRRSCSGRSHTAAIGQRMPSSCNSKMIYCTAMPWPESRLNRSTNKIIAKNHYWSIYPGDCWTLPVIVYTNDTRNPYHFAAIIFTFTFMKHPWCHPVGSMHLMHTLTSLIKWLRNKYLP